MSNLPVREMVLYKHGVGFFVRAGEVEGTSATLTFRADEVNDILKSLAVFDRSGGQVYGIHYQTPMDTAHRLANTSIHLSNTASMTQLVQQLRGRNARLLVENTDGNEVSYEGRVIGIEHRSHENGQVTYVAIQHTDGMIRQILLDRVVGLTINDEQSEQDLSYFLDTSMREDNRRGVTVRMSEGEHDLVVYYVAPSPTWRVSYRLVAESDEDGNTGTALLQGWGLFDNRLEEDLDNVKVTLVAGQPISFIYDLYASQIPHRPTIQDKARVVEKPVEYESTQVQSEPLPRKNLLGRIEGPRGTLSKRRQTSNSPDFDKMPPEQMMQWMESLARQQGTDGIHTTGSMFTSADIGDSTHVDTETRITATGFQYHVNTPVNVKRGESALVPIIHEKIPYQRELLYNGDKFPQHPVASLRFDNQSGLTLERGPVTVIEDNDYAGEAIIPLVGDGQSVYVPYAVELGITVREERSTPHKVNRLSISSEMLIEVQQLTPTTRYIIENTTDSDRVVTIEAVKQNGYALYNTREPDVDLLNEYRWQVDVPAKGQAEFVKMERKVIRKRHVIKSLKLSDLLKYVDNHQLDESLLDALTDILKTMESIQDIQAQLDKLGDERNQLFATQKEARLNMRTLNTTGKEGTLRLRMVDQMEASQDKLDAIDAQLTQLKAKITASEEKIDTMLVDLSEQY